MTKTKGLWAWDIVKSVLIIGLLSISVNFLLSGFHEDSTRRVIAGTARASVLLFSLAFGASAIHAALKNSFSWWLLMNRKYLGIAFAWVHFTHLLFLFILQSFFHPVFTLAARWALFAGGMAYLFITLMLLTSFDYFAKMISKKTWKYLHLIGGYWIWGVFMSSYVKKVFRVDIAYLPIVLLLVIVFVLRMWKVLKRNGTQWNEDAADTV